MQIRGLFCSVLILTLLTKNYIELRNYKVYLEFPLCGRDEVVLSKTVLSNFRPKRANKWLHFFDFLLLA